jgi:curved DNA-binding protein CbpA
MDVETIKAAIETLSEPERRALADWLQELEDRAWDAEMERDFSHGGRAQVLAEKIDREIEEGKFTPLDDGMRSRQGRR